jgi:hypothetical protein
MGIVKDRAGSRAELLLARGLKALVEFAALVFRGFANLARDRGYLVIAACNAADAIRPTHLLKVIPARFFCFEFLVYVYQVHISLLT